ncbi:unnamed protein product [Closterium sp. NIES-53]
MATASKLLLPFNLTRGATGGAGCMAAHYAVRSRSIALNASPHTLASSLDCLATALHRSIPGFPGPSSAASLTLGTGRSDLDASCNVRGGNSRSDKPGGGDIGLECATAPPRVAPPVSPLGASHRPCHPPDLRGPRDVAPLRNLSPPCSAVPPRAFHSSVACARKHRDKWQSMACDADQATSKVSPRSPPSTPCRSAPLVFRSPLLPSSTPMPPLSPASRPLSHISFFLLISALLYPSPPLACSIPLPLLPHSLPSPHPLSFPPPYLLSPLFVFLPLYPVPGTPPSFPAVPTPPSFLSTCLLFSSSGQHFDTEDAWRGHGGAERDGGYRGWSRADEAEAWQRQQQVDSYMDTGEVTYDHLRHDHDHDHGDYEPYGTGHQQNAYYKRWAPPRDNPWERFGQIWQETERIRMETERIRKEREERASRGDAGRGKEGLSWEEMEMRRLLGLATQGALTPASLKAAYHRCAKQWHPDAQHGLKPEDRAEAERRFKRISSAYETLSARLAK